MQTSEPIGLAESRQTQRRHGRVSCEMVRTGLGDVKNVSAEGMCVSAKSTHGLVPGQRIGLRLAGTIEIELAATVIWTSRRGFRKHLIGFHFEGVSQEQRQALTTLARQCSRSQSIVQRGQYCAA
jgi:hypothetical protein